MTQNGSRNRIPYIDGLRGYLILSMTLSHLGLLGTNYLSGLSHKSISIFFTGEGFMTLSGLMMGFIMLNAVERDGVWSGLKSSLKRSWKIVVYYFAVFILCAMPLVLLDASALDDLFKFRDPFMASSALLFATGLYRPLMFDILFLYIVLIGISPLIIAMAVRLGPHWVLAGSLSLWLFVQFGLVQKFSEKIAGFMGADPGQLFGSFPIFSWQLPFVLGVLAGMLTARGDDLRKWILPTLQAFAFPFAVAACTAFALLRLVDTAGIAGLGWIFFQNYLELNPITLMNFFAFGVVIICLLSSDPASISKPARWARRGLIAVLETDLLKKIGQNSLLTFSGSVVLTYWLVATQHVWSAAIPVPIANTLAFLAVTASLYLLVRLNALIRARRDGRKLDAHPTPAE